MRSAQDLLSELNASDESPRIEAKRAREIGKSIMETVIAFANEPGLSGGYLLLGVESKVDAKGDTQYWAAGVPEGELQSRQEPMLSRKVIREALANAVMHRSYLDHSPI